MKVNLLEYIHTIKDFPKEGIYFKDIQPLLEDTIAFKQAITEMGRLVEQPDYWVGIESRGFIFAAALAATFGGGLRLIRKEGKLPPYFLVKESYDLEYGSDTIEMKQGHGSVILVDDVIATGGTMNASENIVSNAGYDLLDKLVLIAAFTLPIPVIKIGIPNRYLQSCS